MKEQIWKIDSKNKLILQVDLFFKNIFVSTISKILVDYMGIPVEVDDIYYEFLYQICDLSKKFNGENQKDFLKYLVSKLKMFTKNKVRHYSCSSFKIMNSYIPFEYETIEFRDKASEELEETKIDFSILTEKEFLYYKLRFLEGKNPQEIAKDFKISIYSQKKVFGSLKKKIKTQFEN